MPSASPPSRPGPALTHPGTGPTRPLAPEFTWAARPCARGGLRRCSARRFRRAVRTTHKVAGGPRRKSSGPGRPAARPVPRMLPGSAWTATRAAAAARNRDDGAQRSAACCLKGWLALYRPRTENVPLRADKTLATARSLDGLTHCKTARQAALQGNCNYEGEPQRAHPLPCVEVSWDPSRALSLRTVGDQSTAV